MLIQQPQIVRICAFTIDEFTLLYDRNFVVHALLKLLRTQGDYILIVNWHDNRELHVDCKAHRGKNPQIKNHNGYTVNPFPPRDFGRKLYFPMVKDRDLKKRPLTDLIQMLLTKTFQNQVSSL